LTSTAVWKVIFTSVVTNPTTKQNDAWGAYPTEWNALRTFITTNNIKNVVFIAGDLHLGAIDNGTQAGFPEMCVAGANQTRADFCATAATGTWSEGYFDDTCAGYGLVSVLQNPDRLVLQVADQNGVIRVAYTVVAELPTPTPTPTPTATPTPTPTPTPTATPTPTPTATPQGPIITKQPTNASVKAGETAWFNVKAGGTPPLNYQWKKNDVEITGATSSSYTTPPTTIDDNGALISVRVGNGGGTVTSNSVMLRVR
ncbi:MAG: alkaline phosphatase D family protein, partial [Chthoniobacterales bacterium]